MTSPRQFAQYDPFARGSFPVGVRSFEAHDAVRDRLFPCELWYPELKSAEPRPLIVYSHASFFHRKAATFLCTHLASHGYLVAAMDHSETFVPELKPTSGETSAQKAARAEAVLASRVPDIRFLLDRILAESKVDRERIGIAGHSMGGWTALASLEVESRFAAVVAIAPAGASNPKPGIAPAKLTYQWVRKPPVLILAGEKDVPLPLEGMYEIFERTPSTKQMVVLRGADHVHFMDEAEKLHETLRKNPVGGDLAWMWDEMRPFSELCPEGKAHLFTRGLTLCHFDSVLRQNRAAGEFLTGNIEAELAALGIEAFRHPGQ